MLHENTKISYVFVQSLSQHVAMYSPTDVVVDIVIYVHCVGLLVISDAMTDETAKQTLNAAQRINRNRTADAANERTLSVLFVRPVAARADFSDSISIVCLPACMCG